MKTTCFAIFFAVTLITSVASAQTDTTFTYQGELNENGNPANGSFNIDFSLWDAHSGGNQIGTTEQHNGVPVVNGRFTVELDFEANAFDNTDRWLEITVNTNTLVPRTLVTRTPYSVQTRGIFVDDSYNVGIGTPTPRAELEVADFTTGDETAAVGVATEDAAGGLAAYSSTFLLPQLADRISLFSDAFESAGLDLRADGATSDIRMYTGGFDISNERMRITDTGNIGIGTTAPHVPLEVHNRDTGEILRLESDLTRGYIRFREGAVTRAVVGFGDESDILGNALPDSFAIDGKSTALHFAVDSDALKGITINTHGNVSIGATSAPSDKSKLYIDNSSSESFVSAVRGRATNSDATGNVGGSFFAAGSEGNGVYASVSGSDGIGVLGSGTVSGMGVGVKGIADSTGGRGVFGQSHHGEAAVYGYGYQTWDFFAGGPGAHYGEISSIRWKRNIRSIDQPLEKIAQLRGVYFNWDEEHGGQHDIGMIAEEVGAVLPEIVRYEENGIDANGMDYSKLTPLLIEAANALRNEKDAEISEIKQQNTKLREANDELRTRLESLEQIVARLASTQQEKTK